MAGCHDKQERHNNNNHNHNSVCLPIKLLQEGVYSAITLGVSPNPRRTVLEDSFPPEARTLSLQGVVPPRENEKRGLCHCKGSSPPGKMRCLYILQLHRPRDKTRIPNHRSRIFLDLCKHTTASTFTSTSTGPQDSNIHMDERACAHSDRKQGKLDICKSVEGTEIHSCSEWRT